jgi:hypothetical protein
MDRAIVSCKFVNLSFYVRKMAVKGLTGLTNQIDRIDKNLGACQSIFTLVIDKLTGLTRENGGRGGFKNA